MLNVLLIFCLAARLTAAHDGHSHGEEEEPKEPVDESDVLVLTKENFEQTLADNEAVLVEFYAPWCGHCKALIPEYARAATLMKQRNPAIKIAKLDATEHQDLAKTYHVKGFPTLKLFRNGQANDFRTERTAEGIIDLIDKKLTAKAVHLDNSNAVKQLLVANNIVAIGFFPDVSSASAKVFADVAVALAGEVPLAIITKRELFQEYGVPTEEAVILFHTDENERYPFQGEFTVQAIQNFIRDNEMPLLPEFDETMANKLFSGKVKMHLLYFDSKFSAGHNQAARTLRAVAKSFKDKVRFIFVNTEHPDSHHALSFFELTKSDSPVFRIVDLGDDESPKFTPDSNELTVDNLHKFAQGVFEGTIKRPQKKQPVPTNWDAAPVKILVADNFEQVVRDKSKAVFIEFYAPWCGYCKKLTPIWDQLAEAFTSNADIVVAKLDATQNDLPDIKIKGYPTLKYSPKGSEELLEYEGANTFEALKTFLESDGKTVVPEAAAAEEEEAPPAETGEEEEDKDAREEL